MVRHVRRCCESPVARGDDIRCSGRASDHPPAGFSIELWNELARRMQVNFTWIVVSTEPDLLQAVQRGDADVAIAAITMTAEREKRRGLLLCLFRFRFQIMVRAHDESPFLTTLGRFHGWPSGNCSERQSSSFFFWPTSFGSSSGAGTTTSPRFICVRIGEGLWGTMLIIATGEHGDRNAPGVIKRLTVVLMWLLGVVLIAQLTATVTSSQTVQRLQSEYPWPGRSARQDDWQRPRTSPQSTSPNAACRLSM